MKKTKYFLISGLSLIFINFSCKTDKAKTTNHFINDTNK